jgi:hypothetical protein
MQSKGKCRFSKKLYQSEAAGNVIMVAETFTIFIGQLLTLKDPCKHMQMRVKNTPRNSLHI